MRCPAADVHVPTRRGNGTGEEIMALASHLEELQRKHGDIEREIDEAQTHPSTDELQITALKRRKLALKDQIEKLKTQTRH
jgi:hypothetical protein